MRAFGEVLVENRKKKGYSQADLVDLLAQEGIEVTTKAVSKWENLTREPSLHTILTVCQILDIDLNHLLNLQNHENMDLLIQGKDEAKVIHFMRSLSHKEREILMESIQSSIRIIEKMRDLKE